MKRIAFMANASGVGQTTLVYHVGHMMAEMGLKVLMVDLDPQAGLTAMCLSEGRLEALWSAPGDGAAWTVVGGLRSGAPYVEPLRDGLGLVLGDPALAMLEGVPVPGFDPLLTNAASAQRADVILLDLPANLGTINRSAITASDHVVTPMAPDMFSLRGVHCLGETLAAWQQTRLGRFPAPVGYLFMQGGMRLARPIQSYARWTNLVPGVYHRSLLRSTGPAPEWRQDPWYLGMINHFLGLAATARDASKPMFDLKPADGAVGALADTARFCRGVFEVVVRSLLARVGEPRGG